MKTMKHDWCEVEERPSGVTYTSLQQLDITSNNIISFAPGEGSKPFSPAVIYQNCSN